MKNELDDCINLRVNSKIKQQFLEKASSEGRHTDIIRSLMEAYVNGEVVVKSTVILTKGE